MTPQIHGLWIETGGLGGEEIRISTVLLVLVFLAIGFFREPRWHALVALVAWFFASEAVFEWAAIGETMHAHGVGPAWIVGSGHAILLRNGLWLLFGPAVVALGFALRIRIAWPAVAALVVWWAIWIALGLPTNNDPAHRSVFGEVMDTGTKTTFALCYLLGGVNLDWRCGSFSFSSFRRGSSFSTS